MPKAVGADTLARVQGKYDDLSAAEKAKAKAEKVRAKVLPGILLNCQMSNVRNYSSERVAKAKERVNLHEALEKEKAAD